MRVLVIALLFALAAGAWFFGSRLDRRLAALDEQVGWQRAELRAALVNGGMTGAALIDDLPDPATQELAIKTVAEAQAARSKMGGHPSAQDLAGLLGMLDGWVVAPNEEAAMRDLKLQLAGQLRQQVKQEVLELQKAALAATKGDRRAAKHADAGQILALYPMSEDIGGGAATRVILEIAPPEMVRRQDQGRIGSD